MIKIKIKKFFLQSPWVLYHLSEISLSCARKLHKFLCLERATIAGRQGASEEQKFVAELTQHNSNLFLINGITSIHTARGIRGLSELAVSRCLATVGCLIIGRANPRILGIDEHNKRRWSVEK